MKEKPFVDRKRTEDEGLLHEVFLALLSGTDITEFIDAAARRTFYKQAWQDANQIADKLTKREDL